MKGGWREIGKPDNVIPFPGGQGPRPGGPDPLERAYEEMFLRPAPLGRVVPLDLQLRVLLELGIPLPYPGMEAELAAHPDRPFWEGRTGDVLPGGEGILVPQLRGEPFLSLLREIGRDREEAEHRSRRVHAFDLPCVDGEAVYTRFLLRLGEISGGELPLACPQCRLYPREGRGWASFLLEGQETRLPLSVEGRWFDAGLIPRLNRLLEERRAPRRICQFVYLQELFLVFGDKPWMDRCRRRTGLGFRSPAPGGRITPWEEK